MCHDAKLCDSSLGQRHIPQYQCASVHLSATSRRGCKFKEGGHCRRTELSAKYQHIADNILGQANLLRWMVSLSDG